jgi:dTMP kinase
VSTTTKGKFITFEGGEGSGKSTQVQTLARWLEDQSIEAVTTREPGGAPSAEIIRTLLVEGAVDRWQPISEVLLHYAARTEHLANTVVPALKSGKWVVSDRFSDSTMAYQGYAHGFNRDIIKRIHRAATGGLMPDLTLILDVSVETGLARAGHRTDNSEGGEDRYERMGSDFHERVRAGFLDIAEAAPERCYVIDAEQDADAVSAQVFKAVSAHLKDRLL